MFKKGYMPINEVTPTPLPSTATSWLVGLTTGVVVAIILSIVLAVVFGVVNVNLRDDLNAATNDLATANTNLQTLEMFAMELAEMSGMNTTYEEITTGRCEVPKGCAADIYSGAYRLLVASTGPFTTLVVELSPFDTLEAKKRKRDDVRSHDAPHNNNIASRAPGESMTITCDNGANPFGFVPVLIRQLLKSGSNPTGYLILTTGQLANFNLTGPNIGNGAGQTKSQATFPFQTVAFSTSSGFSFNFNWYPDFVPCAGDVFDLIAPTKFTIGVTSSTLGSSKKRDAVRGPVQREHAKKSVH